MVAGGDTFIHAMLSKAGFTNVFENSKRYPTISTEQLTDAGADVVFLSSEPYPFKEKDIAELKENLTQTKQNQKIPDIILVNGEYFSWYGSRLLEATDYLNGLTKSVSS
jgi:ABC-type Fe3+-hydroxamate transport system substrate-binding protein